MAQNWSKRYNKQTNKKLWADVMICGIILKSQVQAKYNCDCYSNKIVLTKMKKKIQKADLEGLFSHAEEGFVTSGSS